MTLDEVFCLFGAVSSSAIVGVLMLAAWNWWRAMMRVFARLERPAERVVYLVKDDAEPSEGVS